MAQILPIRFQEHLQVGYEDALEKWVSVKYISSKISADQYLSSL